jgi:hypothetical protein
MGRHVNYADEQERWLNKADKITRKLKNLPLEERDPNSLTLAEQLELEKRRIKERSKVKEKIQPTTKVEQPRISHYRPK